MRQTPVMIPWFSPAARWFNRWSLTRTWRRLLAAQKIREPILVTTFPSTVDLVRSVDAAQKVYYCVDQWQDYPGLCTSHWRAMEDGLLQSVDGFVASSRDLLQKAGGCPACHLPHGVDFDHFHGARQSPRPVPELDRLPRPIVGYFGFMNAWIDCDSLAALAAAFPRVSFVLIGRADIPLDFLARLPNVHRLGPVPYTELPHYGAKFDVGLIPYAINRYTRAVNPLKLFEYLALGLPVVASRLPELEGLAGPIRLAAGPDEFRRRLGETLGSDLQAEGRAAVELARQNTWDQRATTFCRFLEQLSGGGPCPIPAAPLCGCAT